MLIFRAWATCGILAISKPCRVEIKLQVKIVITNPLPCPSHITDAKTESGLVDGFPSMNIFSKSRPYTVFTSFLVSRLVSGLLPCSYRRHPFYYVNDVKIHTSEHLKDLGLHFFKMAFGPSV